MDYWVVLDAYPRLGIAQTSSKPAIYVAQNAWSPVRMARSSILLPQALQLYVQLLQIREPSPKSRRFASESSRVPQVLQRKQLRCHRFPANSGLDELNLDLVVGTGKDEDWDDDIGKQEYRPATTTMLL